MLRPSFIRGSFSAVALAALVVACGSDDDASSSAQIRQFCSSFASSPAFACCSPEDKNEPSFVERYRFINSAQCASVLTNQEASAAGKQVFDGAAAQSCLAHLNSRQCGAPVTRSVRREEQVAGCSRVLTGKAAEGQACTASEDCALGLVCPPVRETGAATCAKPVGENGICYGAQADSVDHPACVEGLKCTFIERTSVCPSPPCDLYKCVPPFDEGEPCSATECKPGLVCRDGSCQQGEPNGAGGSCKVIEHCAQGLYCDVATEKCAARKADGEPCNVANNPLYECKGVCKGSTCASFCGQ